MSTAKNPETIGSALSSEALDLLNCFHSGLEDIVYNIAEEIAKRRQSLKGETIQIESEDVRHAGNLVLDAIKRLAESNEITNEVANSVEEMRECCKRR